MAVKEQYEFIKSKFEAEGKLRERWQKEQEEEARKRQEAEEKEKQRLIDRAMNMKPGTIKIAPKGIVISKIRPYVEKVTKIEELIRKDYPYNSSSKEDTKKKIWLIKGLIAFFSMSLIGMLYGFNRLAEDVIDIPVEWAILISVLLDFSLVVVSFYILERLFLNNPGKDTRKRYLVVGISFLAVSVLFFVGYALV